MFDLKKYNFVITGGNGFLGQHFVRKLKNEGVSSSKILIPSSNNFDLRSEKNVKKILKKNDIVIHLAANVGGLGKGVNKSGNYFFDNSIMGLNLIKFGNEIGIKQFIGVGSILQYPNHLDLPYKERELFSGLPDGVTSPYGFGKTVMFMACKYFKEQFNFNFTNVILPNLYGPGDDFNPVSSHVIPSLIFKIYNSKKNKSSEINVWGDGSDMREFLYVDDAAEAIVLILKKQLDQDLLNIGTGKMTSIRDLASKIQEIMNYNGEINWETKRKLDKKNSYLDVNLAREKLNFNSKTNLNSGLLETIKWFNKNKNKFPFLQ